MLFKGLEPLYIKVIHLKSIVSTISTKIAINYILIYIYNLLTYKLYIIKYSPSLTTISRYRNRLPQIIVVPRSGRVPAPPFLEIEIGTHSLYEWEGPTPIRWEGPDHFVIMGTYNWTTI